MVKGEETICTNCMLEMAKTDDYLYQENALYKRLSLQMPLARAMALFKFSKNGRVQQVLHQLKYKNHPEIGVVLGRVYGERMIAGGLGQAFDLILPVPLHPARRRRRGYNQSAKFAEGLSEKLGIPFSDSTLERGIKTETQTRKSKLDRLENMKGVFQVNRRESLAGKRILLVDDVVTTGATLEACGQLLFKEGCSELSIACIAET
ncbi:ComF family protein [Chryseolinea soli]|uniref:ComF family protein n=1 Tax=Chryseolinea soli TaxID=2321403 RepID=A0A385SUD3_9BACT|nr:ComF family protein [Chryseolinea soli]